jgi:hypothetical protein
VKVLEKAFSFIRLRSGGVDREATNHQEMMRQALDRVATAQLMLREATTLEQLDMARTDLASAHAGLQQVIRQAKRDRGIALRSIPETEAIFRQMREHFRGNPPPDGGGSPTRKKGGGRAG